MSDHMTLVLKDVVIDLNVEGLDNKDSALAMLKCLSQMFDACSDMDGELWLCHVTSAIKFMAFTLNNSCYLPEAVSVAANMCSAKLAIAHEEKLMALQRALERAIDGQVEVTDD